jgi:hypothetical protein
MEAERRRGGIGQAQEMSCRWRDERGIARRRERGPTYTLWLLTADADGFLSGSLGGKEKKNRGGMALLLWGTVLFFLSNRVPRYHSQQLRSHN